MIMGIPGCLKFCWHLNNYILNDEAQITNNSNWASHCRTFYIMVRKDKVTFITWPDSLR